MKAKPEILVLWRGFFPSTEKGFISGPTSPIAYEIFRRIVSNSFTVTIICWHFSPQPYTDTVEGINIIRIKKPSCKYFNEQLWGLKMSTRALYEITRRKINLLHIMGEPIWHGWSLFMAKLSKIPTLMSFLDPWYPLYIYEEEMEGRKKGKIGLSHLIFNKKTALLQTVIPFLEKLYAKYANKVTVVTDDLKQYYISRGISEKKMFVISNATSIPNIKEEKVLSLKNVYGLNNSDTVIGYLGGIRKIHGAEVLLRSFIILAQKHKNIKLVYIGNGNDVGLLKSQIPEELKDKVIFIGKVSYKEVPNYLSLIDCGFISWENNLAMSCASPLKVFEYMAAKKPVIGGCTAHIKQIIEKNNSGIFMKNRTVECAIEALSKFINLPTREKIRLGENAYQYIYKTQTWDIIANKYVGIYNGLIHDEKRNFEVIL